MLCFLELLQSEFQSSGAVVKTTGTMLCKMCLIPKFMSFWSHITLRTLIRTPWIYGCFSILFLGLGTFLVDPNGSGFPEALLALTILLSFPSGLAAFLLTWPFVDINPAANFVLLWMVVASAGYLQWFRFIPNLRGGITTLSLNQGQSGEKAEQSKMENPVIRPSGPKAKRVMRIVHFDAAGQTPLERVISNTRQKPPARVIEL
jgi:hypothetical protein